MSTRVYGLMKDIKLVQSMGRSPSGGFMFQGSVNGGRFVTDAGNQTSDEIVDDIIAHSYMSRLEVADWRAYEGSLFTVEAPAGKALVRGSRGRWVATKPDARIIVNFMLSPVDDDDDFYMQFHA
jgi:hypothetical protein